MTYKLVKLAPGAYDVLLAENIGPGGPQRAALKAPACFGAQAGTGRAAPTSYGPFVSRLRTPKSLRCSREGPFMDTTTILVIILVLLLVGGGWYGRGRWF